MKILIAFIVFIFSAQCSSNNIQPFEAHEKCLSNNTLCNRRNASSVNSIPANTNMVNYSIQTGTTSYEVFDSSTFHNRSLSQETTDPLSQIISQNNMPKSIISTDERFQITNAKIQPYLSTAKLIATYDNVYNQATKEYQKITYSGTAFMAGSNIALTAGHCYYTDVTNTGNYNDNINNPRFPDKIELFFGCDQSADINQGSSYQYYAEGTKINIELAYFCSPNLEHDWGVIELDRPLGNTIGWPRKITNWYELNAEIYSWRYPADKPRGTLWKTVGRIKKEEPYRYYYDFDSYGGQSGSPIFMTGSDGSTFVCGIHTSGQVNENGGTRINNLIFYYTINYQTPSDDDYSNDELNLSVNSKNGSIWSINISNTTSHLREVYYNSKMCNFSDARDWTNLKDIETIIIYPYQTKMVTIRENWFATSITVSYIYHSHRVITYADNLHLGKVPGLDEESNILPI